MSELGPRSAAIALLALLSFTACAATPDVADLDEARATYAIAARHPNLDVERSADMQDARRQLRLADRAVAEGADQEVIDHHAYLAKGRARIAQALAGAASANAKRAALEAENADLRLAASSAELERTRREAAIAGEAARRARALEAQQTERGLVLTLGGVLFAFNSADLKIGAKLALARVAGFLIALPHRQVVIEGHTDDVGSQAYNLALSRRRAESVRDYLVESGIEAQRIAADGFGKRFPVAGNDSDEGRGRNRRVEVVILEPGEAASQERRHSPK